MMVVVSKNRGKNRNKRYRKHKKNDWGREIKIATEQLNHNRMWYKDKPVNGSPTDRQIYILESICKDRQLKLSIIGITKKEASQLIEYLSGDTKEIPKCYEKYIE